MKASLALIFACTLLTGCEELSAMSCQDGGVWDYDKQECDKDEKLWSCWNRGGEWNYNKGECYADGEPNEAVP